MRTSSILLVLMFLVGFSLSLQSTVNAQPSYVTVYGELTYYQCPVGVQGPCQSNFYLATNGTTPGIPTYSVLDFSQSIVPAPTQSDVGKAVSATGYYAPESQCTGVAPCYAFFVHIWGPHYGASVLPTTTGCFSSSEPPTTWYSVQCLTAPTMPEVVSQPLGTPVPFNLSVFLSNSGNLIIIAAAFLLGYLFLRNRRK